MLVRADLGIEGVTTNHHITHTYLGLFFLSLLLLCTLSIATALPFFFLLLLAFSSRFKPAERASGGFFSFRFVYIRYPREQKEGRDGWGLVHLA